MAVVPMPPKATFHLPLNPFLQSCGLPGAWAQQSAWRILDTDWQDGARFLACMDAWRHDALRPRMLHYVALSANCDIGTLTLLSPSTAAQFQDLQPGFNRLSFCGGQVLLTLCVGELKPMLRAQSFVADSVFLPQLEPSACDDWAMKALLRCCRRGTALAWSSAQSDSLRMLTRHGFELTDASDSAVHRAHFNPRWQIKSSRRRFAKPALAPSSCIVIGAGLAGASTAASLARRGWRVQVLDAGAAPASGASGLPVGLMVPSDASDANPRSWLLHAGVKLTLQQAYEHLVQGQDWAQSGVMMMKPDRPADWLPDAAWIKPSRLVQAWLAQPNVHFQGNAAAASLHRSGDEWLVCDAANTVLARASLVVLAAPSACAALLLGHASALRATLNAFHGQVSWAQQRAADDVRLPVHPLNGSGHLVAHVPLDGDMGIGKAWFAGATYLPGDAVPQKAYDQHVANLLRLADLHAGAAQIMSERMRDGSLQAWQGTRFTTRDRMPRVGEISGQHVEQLDGTRVSRSRARLCINTGFGSRGLSWSVLCAELLAAQLSAEPLPMPDAWQKLLDCEHYPLDTR